MGRLATFLVACLFLFSYIPFNDGFSIDRNRRDTDGTLEGLVSGWLTVGQQQEIKLIRESDQNFRPKYIEFFEKLPADRKKVVGRQIVEACFKWVQPVTSNEELLELSKLHHNDHEGCKNKIKEYLGRVPDAQKAKVEKNLQICDDIWYKSHIELSKRENLLGAGHVGQRVRRHDHEGHVGDHGAHKLEDYFKNHLSWLTDAQKEELKTLKTEGKSRKDLQDKVFAYYEEATGETKEKATTLLRSGCKELLTKVIGEEKTAELKKLKDSNAPKDDIEKKVKEFLDAVTDPHLKQIADEYRAPCKKLYGVGSRKIRSAIEGDKLEEALTTHLSWLTDDQKAELKKYKDEGKTFEDAQKKVFEWYGALSGEPKEKATQLLQEGCRKLIKELVGEEKAAQLKTLRESGASKTEIKDKIVKYMDELTDPAKKEKAVKFAGGCQKVFEIDSSRVKRTAIESGHFDKALDTHLSWLTADQKAQLKTLKDEGKSFEDVQTKVFEFYNALSGEAKEKATTLLQEGCRSIIKDLVGEEKAGELKKLRESGASKADIKAKIVALMDELTDPAKKEKALKFAGGCQKVFEIESRKKRDAPQSKLDEYRSFLVTLYLKTYLGWLNDDQKETLKTLKAEGKPFQDLQNKVFEFYESLPEDKKKAAKEQLQNGCRGLIKEIAGEEKANELKTLRESGASKADLEKKIAEFVDALTDEGKKQTAVKYAPACKRIFDLETPARVKRDEGQGKLEAAFTSYLAWLTEDQKQALRTLKNEGKEFSELQSTVFGYYEALTGEQKEKAAELLKGGCRELFTEILGEEKTAELKKLKESGGSNDEVKTKAREFIDALTDETKKEKAKQYSGACEKIFGVSSRKKRDHHEGHEGHDHEAKQAKLEAYFATHLSWLTEDQKKTLKDLCMEDKTDKELQAKVFEFYDALTGDAKEKATQLLQEGCRKLIKELVGEEKAGELKKLKESGASKDDIHKKVQELIEGLTDDGKKKKAQEYGPACKKVFGVSRKKRSSDVDSAKFDEALNSHLKWLTDDQKAQLKTLKDEGKSFADIQKKVFEFFEGLSGEAKTKAAELLKEGCRSLIKEIIGDEKANELKKLRESGAPGSELKSKVVAFMDEVTDPAKKEKATKYAPSCFKIFELEDKTRVKKSHPIEADKLEESLNTHLSWLTDDQKAELKKYKDEGKTFEDAQKKVFEWYGALSGEPKEKATQLLQEGCRKLIKELVGEEKAAQLKTLRESGASKTEIKDKIVKYMDELTDPAKKEKAVKFAGGCQKVFEIDSSRVKRTAIESGHFDKALETHLSWLTADQKAQLKTLKDEGKSFEDVQTKVFEFYNALSGEAKEKATTLLQEGCRSLIKELVGDEKAGELKKLRESGASKADIKAKIVALMDELTDPAKKEKALKFAGGCQKVFEIESRKKRDAPQSKLDEYRVSQKSIIAKDFLVTLYLKTYLGWLNDDQKETLKTLKAEGKPFQDLQNKVFEFYESLPEDKKKAAKEQLQNGCRGLIKEIAGEEKANELKTLRESGASKADLEKKIAEFVDALTDEGKKQTAVKYAPACKRIFDLEIPARVKRDHHVEADKLQEALNTHLSWLTNEQKATLKTLQSEGKSFKDVNDKVFEYYGQLSGEAKDKAKELMQGGCRALIKELAGDEKAEELKKLRESGASKEEIKKKVVSFLDALTDEEKKKKALKYAPACQKIFDLDEKQLQKFKRSTPEEDHIRYLNLLAHLLQFTEVVPFNKTESEKQYWIRGKIDWIFYGSTNDHYFENLQNSCKFLLANGLGLKFSSKVPKENNIHEVVRHAKSKDYNNQTLKAIAIFGDLCKRTSKKIEKNLLSGTNTDFTVGDELVDLYEALPKNRKLAIRLRWKAQCVNWIKDGTDEEERDRLKMLLRNKKYQVLRERINLLIGKFGDAMRTKVAHYRLLCERLFNVI